MLTERTIIDQIEICCDGAVRIRFSIQILNDGKVIHSAFHRTSIPMGVPAEAQMAAVAEDFALNGRPPFDPAEVQRVVDACSFAASQWDQRLQDIADSLVSNAPKIG